MIRISAQLSIGIYALMMGLGLAHSDIRYPYLFCVAIFLCWILLTRMKWTLLSNIMLIVAYLFAAYGLMNNANPAWILPGCLFGIMAWDLEMFHRYISSVDMIASRGQIIRRHFAHMSGLMGTSGVLAMIGLQLHLELNLYLTIGLVIILLLFFRRNA